MNPTLKGLRILNTRPVSQAQELSKKIIATGGTAIECPTIEIQATNNNWLDHLPHLNNVNQAIFISSNAVHYCFAQLKLHDIQWPASIKVIAIGHSTAKTLNDFNIPVHHIPDIPNSEHLLSIYSWQDLKTKSC